MAVFILLDPHTEDKKLEQREHGKYRGLLERKVRTNAENKIYLPIKCNSSIRQYQNYSIPSGDRTQDLWISPKY